MSFDSGMYMAEEGLSEVIGTLITAALSNVLSFGVAIFAYVFGAISLYCIAQRRGIKNPWMAWVPVLNCWILGSISDQYRYVVKGQVRNRRTLLLVLKALQVLGCIAGFAGIILGAVFAGLVYVIIALVVKLAGVKWIDKLMPPVVIGPTVSIIGLSLAGNAVGDMANGIGNAMR